MTGHATPCAHAVMMVPVVRVSIRRVFELARLRVVLIILKNK